MPGGKIAFCTGLLERPRLSDDEVAIVMGHEVAHALLEHGRERVGEGRIAQGVAVGASVLSRLLGYDDLGGAVADAGARFMLLEYGRDDEKEADAVGLDLAARAGYDPRAAPTLRDKMARASGGGTSSGGGGLEWLSTRPSSQARTREIEALLPKVMPLYERAPRLTPGPARPPARAPATVRRPGPRGRIDPAGRGAYTRALFSWCSRGRVMRPSS